MDGKFWLLLLIIVIAGLVGGTILFLMRYAKLKENVNRMLKDCLDQLSRHREILGTYSSEYHSLFPDHGAGNRQSLVQKYRRIYKEARESNRSGLGEQDRISRSLPRMERASLDYWLRGIDRMQLWRKADREARQLQLDLQANENRIREVERSLQELRDLPLKTAGLAGDTRDLLKETKDLLDTLNAEYDMSGKTMEDSLQLMAEVEKDLEKIPRYFFDMNPEDLFAIPNIRLEAAEAQPILDQTREHLNKLNAHVKEWDVKIVELRKRSVGLQERVKETGLSLEQRNEHLVLSDDRAQFSSLCQGVDQVRARIAAPTVEDLDPTWAETQKTLNGLEKLNQTLNEYGTRLKRLQDLHERLREQFQAVDNTMKAASARLEYPLQWKDSQIVFEDVQGKFASIPSLTERRTPEELTRNLETAGTCAESLATLREKTEKTAAELEQLSKLWVQIKPAFTREWLAGVEQLFSEGELYDMESNWSSSDHVGSIFSDASDLLGRAVKNIPFDTSLTVQEDQVHPRLVEAEDLAAKKTLFDERRARIELRLRQMQDEEKKAGDILRRVSPVVSLFVREIDSINIPTKSAQNMKAANETQVKLENSLGQRNQGDVSEKYKDVCAWEKYASENGAMVCRWVEEDRLQKMVSISGSLRAMETFAADLTDDIVVKAHKYDLEYVPTPIDTERLKTQSLDAIREDAVNLFAEWHEVMEIQAELSKFLAPVREEHDRMLAELNDLHENCTQVEARLGREWPVVFQTARILQEKVENLAQAIEGSRNLRWTCNDLQRNHYHLFQKLHDLRSEANTIRQMDEQDIVEMQTLEKEYQNSVRDYARRVYEGNDAGLRKEIAEGDAYLKLLADQYKNGRKNGTNTPPALDVKAQLKRKTEAYKQKLTDFNHARVDESLLERERRRQFMPVGKEISVPLNKGEFVTALLRLIMDLDKITSQHPDIADAIEDLRSAHREALKNRPDPSEIKRVLKNARGTLVAVEKTVPEVALVLDGINTLAGVIQNIFR